MMEWNRDRLLHAYPATPEVVRARVESVLVRLEHAAVPTQARRRPAPRRLSFALTLIGALLLAALGVAAGVRFGVFDFMTDSASGVLPQAQELVQRPAASLGLPRTSLALEEAVYDGGVLRVVYSIRAKNALPAPGDESDPESAFARALAADQISVDGPDWFMLDGEEVIMTGGSYAVNRMDEAEGRMLRYLDIQLSASGLIPTEDFTISLPVDRSGEQRLVFPVSVRSRAQAAAPIEADGVRATVVSASASPVRCYVHLRLERMEGADGDAWLNALGDWSDSVLLGPDGEILSSPIEMQRLSGGEGAVAEMSFTFPPTDAEEVSFAPTRINPNDEWTADTARAVRIR